MCLQYKSFENTVGKGEIAHEQFLLFPQCFLPIWRTFYHFRQIWRLQTLSIWKSLKFAVWERVKLYFVWMEFLLMVCKIWTVSRRVKLGNKPCSITVDLPCPLCWNIVVDRLIVWCSMPFSTVFQLHCGSQCTYPCFPGSYIQYFAQYSFQSFPHNHCRNNGQWWERNESCCNDYQQFPEPKIL